MHHRGPDNFSTYCAENIALAHNRLSIIDLSDSANQPFTDERYALTYNGEIYNYLELKRDLEQFDIKFRSTSDTEVLFYYLGRFGIDKTLNKLEGMYAFAFYDRVTGDVVLARDRFGIKPLYWYERGSTYYFASEMKAIAAVTPVETDPLQVLFSITGGSEGRLTSTVFKGIKPIKPGSYLKISKSGKVTETFYYSLIEQFDRRYCEQLGGMSSHEVNDLFSHLFNRSVKAMLVSDAPMGAFVSGGVDSSLVASTAIKDKRIDLFTANVVGEHSEVEDARLLSQSLGATLHVYDFEPDMFLRDWAEVTYYYEYPLVTFVNSVPFSNVSKLAHEASVKAVLTGEGADELFHGYPQLITRKFDKTLNLPFTTLKSIYKLVPKLSQYLKLDSGKSTSDYLGILTGNFDNQSTKQRFFAHTEHLNNKDKEQYYTTIEMFNSHLLGLLHRNDRMGMIASIESRFPFLDEELVKFGINLPVKFKQRKTWRLHNYKHPFIVDKAPIRTEAEKTLPRKLVRKAKWGFGVNALHALEIKPGFFSAGYISEICGLNRKGEQQMLEEMPRYYLGKLASIEIFGRLFSHKVSMENVNGHLLKHISMS